MSTPTKRVPDELRQRWPRKDAILSCRLTHPMWSSRQIARQVGCEPGLVRITLRKAGLKLAVTKWSRKLSEMDHQAIADAYRDGEKVYALAAEYNVQACTICSIARNAGIPRRQIGGFRV